MNKATRMLAIAGMALAAGATIGASPAMAASSTTQSGTTVASQNQSGDRVVGYYRSYRTCDRVGDFGERTHRWDDHDCYRIRYGFRHDWYALSVDYNNWNDRNHNWNDRNNHNWNDRNNHHRHH
jgi:hypothetical protein